MRYGARIAGRRPIDIIDEERSRMYEAKDAVKVMLQENMIWRNFYINKQHCKRPKNHLIPLDVL